MKHNNIIQDKSYAFALRIVALYKALLEQRKEFVLSKQLLRSGTSIGANVEEAIGAHSTKDFIAKLTIAYKESRETNYWLRILKDTKYINGVTAESYIKDCNELSKIIASIQKTMKIRNS